MKSAWMQDFAGKQGDCFIMTDRVHRELTDEDTAIAANLEKLGYGEY
jgi:hypothetical protein